jgi:PPOX class probable F420-dependent enzyme
MSQIVLDKTGCRVEYCIDIPDDRMSGDLEAGSIAVATSSATVAGITLAQARFINLVTFRRTGEPVGTPVLFWMDGNRLLVRTAHDAGKLKRLQHTPDVEVVPSDSRGRRLGSAFSGSARILGPEAVQPALSRLHAKYRLAGPLFTAIRHARGKRDVIVEIVLDDAISTESAGGPTHAPGRMA